RRRSRGRGEDLRYNLTLSFEEAVSGTEKKIKIPRHGPCEICHGSGAKPGTAPQTCPTCRGRGQINFQQGFFSVSRTCNQCHGQGTVIKEACASCGGAGRVRKLHTLSVRIPAGVDTGSRLKLRGEGETGPAGGSPGDLYVVIQVEPHPIFVRDNLDIVCEVPISFVQAALGASIDVPTLDGKVKMKIPAGTQSGKVFRLRGKGIPSLDGYQRGDQHVRGTVELPDKLTKQQRTVWEAMAELAGCETMPSWERIDAHPHVSDGQHGLVLPPAVGLTGEEDGCVRGTVHADFVQLCSKKQKGEPTEEGGMVEHWAGTGGDFTTELFEQGKKLRVDG